MSRLHKQGWPSTWEVREIIEMKKHTYVVFRERGWRSLSMCWCDTTEILSQQLENWRCMRGNTPTDKIICNMTSHRAHVEVAFSLSQPSLRFKCSVLSYFSTPILLQLSHCVCVCAREFAYSFRVSISCLHLHNHKANFVKANFQYPFSLV